ncbi:DNA damage checkpoint control protein rad1 [Pleurostoma richardsiae]|uniref:DNA damage checkpoint control protein rad1 n=1 Tax=Pleurostoma richardsiae TaxID=41990 RepID=A0AA38R3N5_9PEZI|nr:DNA damage checkpoint control protein rad1 [Pleurostoma richardsiae]
MATPSPNPPSPLFRAVASSTRPLYQLLRCISFTNKVHVEITEEGIKFAADQSRVMQGVANLGKSLFTTYILNLPPGEDEEEPNYPSFQISLPAFLETIQIFGAADVAARQAKADADPYRSNLRNYRPDAFSNQTLGMPGTCCLSYSQEGEPFSIILEESGVNTTCNLVTYLPESPEEIPFDRDDLAFKIIMQSRLLLDALVEMAPTSPDRITITASKREPYLRLSSNGPLGGSSVDFSKGRELLETFSVRDRWTQTFRFDMIKSASEAMRIASKVSLRGDGQGVLSLQFMVEVEGGGVNFLIFSFVPYVTQEDDEGDDEGDEGEDVQD